MPEPGKYLEDAANIGHQFRADLTSTNLPDPIGRAGLKPMRAPEQLQVRPPERSSLDIGALLNAVNDPNQGLNGVTLPDGTKVTGAVPKPLAGAEGQGQVAPASPQSQSFFQRAGNFFGSNQFATVAARAAQAITARDPLSPAHQLAGVANNLASSVAYENYTNALREGRKPTEQEAFALSAQERQAAMQSYLQERITESRIANIDAQTAGTLTKDEKLQEAQAERDTRMSLGELSAGVTLINGVEDRKLRGQLQEASITSNEKLAGLRNNEWMNVGNGYVFNFKNQQIMKIYDSAEGDGASAVGKLNSSDYKLFRDLTAEEFLPVMWKKYNAELKKEYKSFKELQAAFSDPESGGIDPSKVFAHLGDEDKVAFAEALNSYTQGIQLGYPPTSTYFARIKERFQSLGTELDKVSGMPDWVTQTYSSARQKQYVDLFQKNGFKATAQSNIWEKDGEQYVDIGGGKLTRLAVESTRGGK